MSKVGRNDPCPCGSGKKYKKCCEAVAHAANAEKARAARAAEVMRALEMSPRGARPIPPASGYDGDILDELSNGVVDLIAEQRFDAALASCERLLTEYPDVVDGLERSAMVQEARGDLLLAIDFYRRSLAFTERPEQKDGFDEDGRDYFREKIDDLVARTQRPVR